MNKEALINQLFAMRATIDSALAILAEEENACKHENKIELTTFGGPKKFKCKDCDYEWTEN